ncbi:sugar ABC transporter substrate-binding protein [Rhodoblastus sphagnicola]|uniref:Sugar ABC transporter substrate-binding protein n=1 Tax=Rhodoblastus sphagnicola TaxID=333368 RepID=A0A2S6N988_9HYPH|nr:substrate-binding domain-containing protein [Rhodoblastus sphagnicola]MBB4200807.1 ribose transport system substrate-binding protein/inositol transport system substrate-binding protein [Rhodoblastus sphagnicola]PPQ31157.1 sugar ABC transporter substrate-binding protein [Rhodoblastus sphagnicola]
MVSLFRKNVRGIATGCVAFGILFAAAEGAASATMIGVSMNPPEAFFKLLKDGIQDHLKTTPGVEVKFEFVESGAGPKQIGQVKEFIHSHVDAIVVLPVDASATGEITRLAQEAKIPLVYVNNGPREDWFAGRIALALPNDLIAGRLQMAKLAQLIGGKGKIVILRGPSTHSAAGLRTQGVKEILADYPGITIIEEAEAGWDRKIAQDTIAGWLAKGDKIDAIAANNDEMAIGAANALIAARIPKDQILVAGVDATPDGVKLMRDGGMAVTVYQDAALEGRRAIDDAIKLSRNEVVQQYDWVALDLVTTKNLASCNCARP